jgi:copper resistance protein B
MRIKLAVIASLVLIIFPTIANAGSGPSLLHAFRTEIDSGDSRDGKLYSWDFDGWIGGDFNKLWLKSEGEKLDSKTAEQAEHWAMYSRNIATFWDFQTGIRYDEQPNSTSYFVTGFEGLAPYFFETEAHFFISEDGDLTARIRQENDLLITQQLIIQPYFELNFSAQNIPEKEMGSGLTDGEFGIQTRYEFSRKFAPYIDLKYERKFGKTSSIAKADNENRDDFVTSIGLRLLF